MWQIKLYCTAAKLEQTIAMPSRNAIGVTSADGVYFIVSNASNISTIAVLTLLATSIYHVYINNKKKYLIQGYLPSQELQAL